MGALTLQKVKIGVARQIARLREERGITQDKMAEACDVSVKYYQRLERGEENLSLESLMKLANILEVDLKDLIPPLREPSETEGKEP